MNFKSAFICIFYVGFTSLIHGQDIAVKSHQRSIGFTTGVAAEAYFPFTKPDYNYETYYIKIQWQQGLWESKNWKYNLIIEPSFYQANHQLLNFYYIKPSSGSDFQERRDRFTQKRSFDEWALNAGIRSIYVTNTAWSPYWMASIGPMYGDDSTERLKRGFAFSDIVAIGTLVQINHDLNWDLRITARHNSNAGFYFPNFGHNSLGIESGFIWRLK